MSELDNLFSEAICESRANVELEVCHGYLKKFNEKFDRASIQGLTGQQKEALFQMAFTLLDSRLDNERVVPDLLNSLRILSRDKDLLEKTMTEEMVSCLLFRSGLDSSSDNLTPSPEKMLEQLSAMKVIFNILLQSESLRDLFVSKGFLQCLLKQFETSKVEQLPPDNVLFLLKIFFIITALHKPSGPKVRKELRGLNPLLYYADNILKSGEALEDHCADMVSELLKIMYNVIHDVLPRPGPGSEENVENGNDGGNAGTDYDNEEIDDELFKLLQRVTKLVGVGLLHEVKSLEKRHSLQEHSVHLLCAVPTSTFDQLIVIPPGGEDSDSELAAIEAIVNLLNVKLDKPDVAPVEPILVALCKLASTDRTIRKFLKGRILPPLTAEDLQKRPEEGHSLRNKLCRLIHLPQGSATKTAATFIFILCKENVGRMVKYTGYGNAAGLLADLGLLLGGRGPGQYSEDSDSGTEEYEELRDRINSVEGWIKPRDNTPNETQMTEEEKEYEAMKLVHQIQQLTNNKAIQPCRIGRDGKPQPIEHVLELHEGLDQIVKAPGGRALSDSDSD